MAKRCEITVKPHQDRDMDKTYYTVVGLLNLLEPKIGTMLTEKELKFFFTEDAYDVRIVHVQR